MVSRIDLFMPPDNKSRYGVLQHFTMKFGEALIAAGAECRFLKADRHNPKPFLEALYNDPPDCTLSFNGLLPDEQGHFFCDMIKIPHVACLMDSPTQYLALASSPYTIVTSPDRFGTEFFKGLGCENSLFLPHAVESDITPLSKKTFPKYEVTMLSSCIDYETIEELWTSKYSKAVREAMHEAVDISLSDQETSCIQAFIQTMDHHIDESHMTPGILNYPDIIDQIEMYTKGKERVELIRAINDAPVNIFGTHTDLWKKYLKNKPNVTFHESVGFEIAIEVMKQSRIVLNSCAWLKDGTHERILTGLACGALVLTNENIYMREHFDDGESIAFYQMGKWNQVNEQINYYLSHPEIIKKITDKGREIVMNRHTWDQRAKTFLKELKPVLKRIKNKVED